ncbi:MAG TPA: S53 family peptidase [Streptosporangiaceae bacterium]|nr:S53 family peptidase [Streptosporangiaceae bacterium]
MLRRRATARVLGGGAALATMAAAATMLTPHAAGAARPTRATAGVRAARVSVFPEIHVPPAVSAKPSGGYTPAQVRAAYFVKPLVRAGIDGKGQSIVIVDSFGSPTIGHDLAVFDRQFHLRPPGSLTIIHPAGPIPPFRPTETRVNWAFETTLDVEWAHTMAPAARIVLVETPVSENEGTSGFPQIIKAEEYVLAHHLGGVISQSFGATEQTFPKGSIQPLRGAYIEAAQPSHDVTVVSASGDAGATDEKSNMSSFYTYPVTSWPASDPLVTSVGGLDLRLNSLGQRTAPDQVWNDNTSPPSATGGGKSIIFGRPAYQNGVASVVGNHRGVPDISMSASCSHPVLIYQSFARPAGWGPICGTSEATPIFAGVIALADQVAGHPLGPINPLLYQMAADHDPGIVDIARGNNTVTFQQNGHTYTVQGWNAVPGYDLASGLGTVNARWFVRELAALANKAVRGHLRPA